MWNVFWFLIGAILGLLTGGFCENIKRSDLYKQIYWMEEELQMWREKWAKLKTKKKEKDNG